MEGRLPGARGVGSSTGGWKPPILQRVTSHAVRVADSSTGGWKPPILQPTSGGDNSEMPPPLMGASPGLRSPGWFE
jgi:hypothetical protein